MRSRTRLRFPAILAATLGLYGLVWAADSKSPRGSKPAVPGTRVEALEWLDYGRALERAQKEDKHVLIDFYTNWCGWCKKMDRDTYGDSAVTSYLRDHFVLSKVNAESDKRFRVSGGTMSGIELARQFQVSSFPITWFLKPDGSKLDRVSGYVPADRFIYALRFVHERRYEQSSKPQGRSQ